MPFLKVGGNLVKKPANPPFIVDTLPDILYTVNRYCLPHDKPRKLIVTV